MFTGIIQELGKVEKVLNSKENKIFTIKSSAVIKGKKIGQSISVNGTCVTIIKLSKTNFQFEVMPETLAKTNLNALKKGDLVNLEPALTLNQALDGHLVQGHIDTTGEVVSLEKNKQDHHVLTVKFPKEIALYLAFKGSISLNGVSLTISDLQDQTLSVDLIPHTLKNTNLSKLKKGDKINIEIDLIAKHIKRLLDHKESEVKYEYLKERNLI